MERATLLQKVRARNSKVQGLTSQPFGVNLFVPSHQSYTNEQVEHMNAWKPYRKALNLEEPVVNISEEQQFKSAIQTVIKYRVPVCCFTFGIPSKKSLNN